MIQLGSRLTPVLCIGLISSMIFSPIYAKAASLDEKIMEEEFQAVEEGPDIFSDEEKSQAASLEAFDSNEISPYNSVNAAVEVQTNTFYNVQIQSDNTLWLKVSANGNKKLTFVSEFAQSADYQTTIYKLVNSTTLEPVTNSQNLFDKTDSVAFIPESNDWYYIQVVLVSGSNDMTFVIKGSPKGSGYEPDDNIYQAKPAYQKIIKEDTFDNIYDQDWHMLNVTAAGKYYIGFTFQDAIMAPITVYIVDMQSGQLYSLNQQSPVFGAYINLPTTGQYGVCILSNARADLLVHKKYSFIMAQRDSSIIPKLIKVNAMRCMPSEDNRPFGDSFLVEGVNTYIQTQVETNTGSYNNVTYTPILVELVGKQNTTYHSAYILSDGSFWIEMEKPKSYGLDGSWHSGISRHYYDINEINFYDFTRTKIPASIYMFYNVYAP